MYTTVKIHQTVDIKCIHFIVQKLHLNKLLKNKGTSIYVKCPILQGPRPWGEDSCVSDLFSGCSQKTPAREWRNRTRREESSSRMWSQAEIPRGLCLILSGPWDRNLTVCLPRTRQWEGFLLAPRRRVGLGESQARWFLSLRIALHSQSQVQRLEAKEHRVWGRRARNGKGTQGDPTELCQHMSYSPRRRTCSLL